MKKTASLFLLGLQLARSAATDQQPIYLEQGWTPQLRELFYTTPQGSRLIPLNWFLALERAEDETLFSAPANLTKFGWLYHSAASQLPIGFTKEPVNAPGNSGPWMGMTCAACHTGNLSHKGKTIRVDGAPAMADFGAFLGALSRSLLASHPSTNPAKFERLAKQLNTDVKTLTPLYETFSAEFIGRAWMRTPPTPAGPGRVDALTQIVNSLAVFNLGIPENLHPPLAPTSFPFLWLTPKLDFVQWNPIAANPLARNAGQVLGVFGEANFGRQNTANVPPELDSTILYQELYELEKWVADLKPPTWPEEIFGKIDERKWREGKALFQTDCRSCHNMPPFDMTNKADNIAGRDFIKITRVPYKTIGTDTEYIQSMTGRFVQTGKLAYLFGGRTIVPGAEFFSTSTQAVMRNGMAKAGITGAKALEYSGYRFYPKVNPNDPNEQLRSYRAPGVTDIKAGPLLGIWATGPFLHNGSVPSVYEMLLPPDQRSKVFWVGGNEVDTKHLGLESKEMPGRFRFDATLPGNRNTGHAFPAKPYNEKQRMAVIEFLKNPERFN